MNANSPGKSALILTISRVITLCITLGSSMLLSRFRTLQEYGTYSQLLIIVTLATSVFSLGLPNSTNYFLARAETKEAKRLFLSNFYTANTLISIVMGLLIPVFTPYYIRYFDNDLIGKYVFFLCIYPWTQMIIASISNVLVVYNQTIKLLVLNCVNAFVSLFSIIIVQLIGLGFTEYLVLFVIGESIIALWIYIIINSLEGRISWSIDPIVLKEILKYSIPIGLASLVGTINIEIDKLMIGRFFDTEILAIYTNCAKELPFYVFSTALTAVLLPRIANFLKKNEIRKAINMWNDAVILGYYVICFCAMACFVFSPQIITILYSEKYIPGADVFRIYSFVLLLRTTYFGMILNSTGKTKFVFYSSLLSLCLNVLLNYSLYLFLGVIGPAVATVLSILIVGITQLVYSCKVLHVQFVSIFPWIKLLKISIQNVILAIIGIVISNKLGIGTDSTDILISLGVLFVFFITYLLINIKQALMAWNRFNSIRE